MYLNFHSDHQKSIVDKFVQFHLDKDKYYRSWDHQQCAIEGVEDVEVPMILNDVFESVAGALYLDNNKKLDRVWNIYNKIMQFKMQEYCIKCPKSPITELYEMFPRKVSFKRPEKYCKDGDVKLRVSVHVDGIGVYKGIGSDEKLAKHTAAKFALHCIRKHKESMLDKSTKRGI